MRTTVVKHIPKVIVKKRKNVCIYIYINKKTKGIHLGRVLKMRPTELPGKQYYCYYIKTNHLQNVKSLRFGRARG